MKILASLVSEDWQKVRDFANPFGIHLNTMGASAAEEWFGAYFKSGRNNSLHSFAMMKKGYVTQVESPTVGGH